MTNTIECLPESRMFLYVKTQKGTARVYLIHPLIPEYELVDSWRSCPNPVKPLGVACGNFEEDGQYYNDPGAIIIST